MIKKFQNLIFLIIIIFSTNTFGKYDLRKCFLLPVTGNSDPNFSSEVFEKTEDYLKSADWCVVRPTSELLDIFNRNKDVLNQGFENKEVLALVANKSKSGALIKIIINKNDQGLLVDFKVIGENGEDIYFKDEKSFTTDSSSEIPESIQNWLVAYEKTIPFHAQIEAISGKNFKADMGTNIGLDEEMKVNIVHPEGRQIHPLLKEVIGWNKKDLGNGYITEVERDTSKGMTDILDVKVGDWIIKSGGIEKEEVIQENPKYGYVTLALDLDSGKEDIDSFGYTNNLKGSLIGGYLKGEIWFLENLWASLEIDGKWGTINGSSYQPDNKESRSFYKIKGGYRFLTSDNFFGTQIDLYLGYGGYSYKPDYTTYNGPYDATFQGMILGFKGNFPIGKKIRAWLEGEVIFAAGNANNYRGGTVPGYSFFIGGNYFFKPKFSADISLGSYNNTFENLVPGQNVKYYDYSLRLGVSFYF